MFSRCLLEFLRVSQGLCVSLKFSGLYGSLPWSDVRHSSPQFAVVLEGS